LAHSSDSLMTGNTPVPSSAWLFASAWLDVMGDKSGSNLNPEDAPPSSSPSRSTGSLSSPPWFNLLVAEDNLPDALLVREAIRLEKLPLDVHVVPDGQQAIEFIMRAESDPEAPCPHYLLLDLNLPKKDGFEVLQRLRASPKCKDIPVLIMTSSDAPADQNRTAELGASYFRKPGDYEAFLKLGGVLRQLMKDSK
jgi:CheY-like chemotaxis protein